MRPSARPSCASFCLGTAAAARGGKPGAPGPLVPCLTRGSLVQAAAAGGGLATDFLFWASPKAPTSADLALEADTAARTAAAPGALCFLFLPPMLQLWQREPPSASRNYHSTASKRSLHSPGPTPPTCVLHPGFSGLGGRCLTIGPTHHSSASSPPSKCLRRAGPSLHVQPGSGLPSSGRKGKVRREEVKEEFWGLGLYD